MCDLRCKICHCAVRRSAARGLSQSSSTPAPSRREYKTQRSRENPGSSSNQFMLLTSYFSSRSAGHRGSFFLLFFPGGTAGFSAAKVRIFLCSLPVFYTRPRGGTGFIVGHLRLPRRLIMRAEVPLGIMLIPVCFHYTLGFAALNAFAVSM